ncbi:hypothetical protein D3C81_1623510 [compost metagenome]
MLSRFLQMMHRAALTAGQNQRDLPEQLRGLIHIQIEQPRSQKQGVDTAEPFRYIFAIQAVIFTDRLQSHTVQQPAKNLIHRGIEFQRSQLAHYIAAVEAAFIHYFGDRVIFNGYRFRLSR